jgi:hypothetical protein
MKNNLVLTYSIQISINHLSVLNAMFMNRYSERWSCNADSAMFQLYPGENKRIFKTNTLS